MAAELFSRGLTVSRPLTTGLVSRGLTVSRPLTTGLLSRSLTVGQPLTTAVEPKLVRRFTSIPGQGLRFEDPIIKSFQNRSITHRIKRSNVRKVNNVSKILEHHRKNVKLQVQAIMIWFNILNGHLKIADELKSNTYRELLLSILGEQAIKSYEADHTIEAVEILKILLDYPGALNRNILMGISEFANDAANGTQIPKLLNTGKTNAIEGNNFRTLIKPTLYEVLLYLRDTNVVKKDDPFIIGTNTQGRVLRIFDPWEAQAFMLEKRANHANNSGDFFFNWAREMGRPLPNEFIEFFSYRVKTLNNNPNLELFPGARQALTGGAFNMNKTIREELITFINKLLEIYISDTHFTYDSFFNGTYKGDNPEPTTEQKEKDADFSVFLVELSKKLSDSKSDVSKDLDVFFSMFPEFESTGKMFTSEILNRTLHNSKVNTPRSNFVEELRGGKRYKKTRKAYKKKGKRYSRKR